MPNSSNPPPTFNVWAEPWITLEHPEGRFEPQGIEQTLLRAHEYTAIYEPSPLVVVGIHRLLVAILQASLDPRTPRDLDKLWQAGRFPPEAVAAFGQQYSASFDLFSAETPFMQSADLPLQPGKDPKPKTVAYLAPEMPAGTEITHYRHGVEDAHLFCPACAAAGLVTVPAFATSGGAGIKPSINGVPPIYVLPGGKTLFESLVISLTRPEYQPEVASRQNDMPWWTHPPLVEHRQEVDEVGYLHSLTFPARRVRLHPILADVPCTRCGQVSRWGVRTMVFQMGESRPKDAPFWFDPFAAYRLPTGKSKGTPTPVRPKAGQALWREFAGLFLLQPETAEKSTQRTLRPSILDHLAELQEYGIAPDTQTYAFRCIGMRTDMKAKIFEWLDADFEVPPSLLNDPQGGTVIREAIGFATACADVIRGTFREIFGGTSRKSEHHIRLKTRMLDEYWVVLAAPFRQFVLAVAFPEQREIARRTWTAQTIRAARDAFSRAAAAAGDDGAILRLRTQGERLCEIRLSRKRKEYLPDE